MNFSLFLETKNKMIEENDMEEDDIRYYYLDDETYYHINELNNIILIRDTDIPYSKTDALKFYHESLEEDLLLDEANGFIIDKLNNLIFVPLFDCDHNLIDYGYTDYIHHGLLNNHPFHCAKRTNGKMYVRQNDHAKLYMHEIIFGQKPQKGFQIDHENSNGLDNRSCNLREISCSANAANRSKNPNTTSKYLGVSHNKSFNKWSGHIAHNHKNYGLGLFENELDAVKARDIYAVHLYKRAAKLNRSDSGNLFLSEDEITDIITNGLPEKYVKKKKQRDLPTNIATKNGKYYYRIRHGGGGNVHMSKVYDTLAEAVLELAKFKEVLVEKDRKARELVENNIKRKNGIAILETHNINGEVNGEFLVDDHVWKEFVHSKWSLNIDGYAIGNYNGKKKALHIHIYNKYKGDVPDKHTIDHVDRNRKDARLDNLRTATRSQQSQNSVMPKQTRVMYTGVKWDSGKFVCKYKSKTIGSSLIMEEAAEMYNQAVLKDHPNPRLNIITTSGTTIETLFHKNNLTVDIVKGIKTVGDMRAVFHVNEDWRRTSGYVLKQMKKANLEEYKNAVIEYMNRA